MLQTLSKEQGVRETGEEKIPTECFYRDISVLVELFTIPSC